MRAHPDDTGTNQWILNKLGMDLVNQHVDLANLLGNNDINATKYTNVEYYLVKYI